MTEAMTQRARQLGSTWKDEGDGYFSLVGGSPMRALGFGSGQLAYVALPEDHPAVGKPYDDLSPDVNGGLTFGDGNVFGWDYCHYENDYDVTGHIKNALEYFRADVALRANP